MYEWLKQEFDDVQVAEAVWGKDILNALAEFPPDDELDTAYWPTMCCMDQQKWANAIDYLVGRILRENDFELYDMFITAPPERAAALMQQMDVHPDYFQEWDRYADRNTFYVCHRLLRTICDGSLTRS